MSDLFACSTCHCVDSVELAYADALPADVRQHQCTYCKTGTWHERFPREPYNPDLDNVVNRPTGLSV